MRKGAVGAAEALPPPRFCFDPLRVVDVRSDPFMRSEIGSLPQKGTWHFLLWAHPKLCFVYQHIIGLSPRLIGVGGSGGNGPAEPCRFAPDLRQPQAIDCRARAADTHGCVSHRSARSSDSPPVSVAVWVTTKAPRRSRGDRRSRRRAATGQGHANRFRRRMRVVRVR